jgi:hypothetical protein
MLFKSLFTLAYFGLFRVSELVTSSSMQIEGALSLSDVLFIHYTEYLSIYLHRFKTNQKGIPVFLKMVIYALLAP